MYHDNKKIKEYTQEIQDELNYSLALLRNLSKKKTNEQLNKSIEVIEIAIQRIEDIIQKQEAQSLQNQWRI